MVELVDAAYGDELSADLIAELQQELVRRYGGPDATPVDPAQFAPPDGAFLVLVVEGTPVACAGLRRSDDVSGELKRMYVRAQHRGRGYARLVMAAVEDRARAIGYMRLLLETGTAQPEAMALYESAGYERITGFGHYQCEPGSRSYAKALTRTASPPAVG
jgi:GNAT superfamily N-acetyltransferase